jgi:isopentenyl-diphosphate delta-isomerase
MHGIEVRSSPGRPEQLILVDAANRATGTAEKLFAHRAGLRHRAFSIFLVDESGRLLLQRRSPSKYHSGGLWANSCCGHPRPGEATRTAAARRLDEELGTGARLRFGFRTAYRAALPNGLIENEIVSVYFGRLTAPIRPQRDEVAQTRLIALGRLEQAMRRDPNRYACWLHHYVAQHRGQIARLSDRCRAESERCDR